MKIHLTLELFASPTLPYCEVSGEIDLVTVPTIGSGISFLFPNNRVLPINVARFPGILRVTDVWFTPQGLGNPVTVKLEDLVLDSKADASAVMQFMERGFGLAGNVV